ncbi:MAG: isoamylase early set domain-containing protein [Spirochaetales bacterium]|nr:isoamylase early set domain-containing protein [Spirochaetales bacterium]
MNTYSSTLSHQEKKGRERKSAWQVHIIAYGTGILFLIVTLLLLIFTGIPGLNKDIILVSFSLAAPEAESVSLVGNFNNWNPDTAKMVKENGIWEIKVELKKGQVYTYNYVINGEEWITDPDSLLNVDDGFGGESSILKL